MQLFKSADAKGNRKFMWQSFQTLVHEYIHTLNHSRYRAYSAKLSKTDAARGHTLREGATEYLIYAPSVVHNGGAWNVYFGGWDNSPTGNDEVSVAVSLDNFATFNPHAKLRTPARSWPPTRPMDRIPCTSS